MAYNPLHHKYRPQTFAQLVGQGAIAATLTSAIASRRIAPAYLFTGPRGTGKTSSARILAKSLNCQSSDGPTAEPCGHCASCQAIATGTALDVIEIDAASHTGVDNIRDLIERAQFAPVSCRYKVYVIDECHMLSTAAFNALLKTLEEPPARVLFVLATTDPQRVLPTIISRCQRFDFRRIPLAAMTTHLQAIAQQEAIQITPEALTLVAQIANGGLRDAESLLDQLSLLPPPVTPEAVWDLVGAVPERDLLALVQALRRAEVEVVIDRCRHLLDRGREPLAVLQSLAHFYLHLLIAKTAPQRGDLIAVTQTTWEALCQEVATWEVSEILRGQQQLKAGESQLRHTTQPRLWLEVAVLELLPVPEAAASWALATPVPAAAKPAAVASPAQPPSVTAKPAAAVPASEPPAPGPQAVEPPAPEPAPGPQAVEPPPAPEPAPEPLPALWQRVLEQIRAKTARSLIAQHCDLMDFDPEQAIATIGLRSPKLVKLVRARLPVIQTAFEAVCQRPVMLEIQTMDAAPSPPPPAPSGMPRMREASPAPLVKPPVVSEPEPCPEAARLPEEPDLASAPEAASALPDTALPDTETPESAVPLALSDLDRAAQRLAATFKGEVIELELDFSSALAASAPAPEFPLAEPATTTSAEDNEIPF